MVFFVCLFYGLFFSVFFIFLFAIYIPQVWGYFSKQAQILQVLGPLPHSWTLATLWLRNPSSWLPHQLSASEPREWSRGWEQVQPVFTPSQGSAPETSGWMTPKDYSLRTRMHSVPGSGVERGSSLPGHSQNTLPTQVMRKSHLQMGNMQTQFTYSSESAIQNSFRKVA